MRSVTCDNCGKGIVDPGRAATINGKVFCGPDCLTSLGEIPDGLLHQPKNTMPEINTIWAVLSVDPEDGNEGVCAAYMGSMMMPLIAADEVRLDLIVTVGISLAKRSGQQLRLVKFDSREDLGLLWSDNDRELAKIAREITEQMGLDTTPQ